MNSKTLSNFHKFGKVGKITMTVLMVIAILAAAASCVATIYVSTLPKDSSTVFSSKKNRMKRCKGADNGTYCFKAGPRNGGPENEPE